MPIETKSKIIEGIEYKHTIFSAISAQEIGYRLTKALAPSIGAGAGVLINMSKKGVDSEIDSSVLGTAAQMLFNNMSLSEYQSLTQDLFKTTLAIENGQTFDLSNSVNYGNHFAGRTGSLMLKVAAWIVKENDLLPFVKNIGFLKDYLGEVESKSPQNK